MVAVDGFHASTWLSLPYCSAGKAASSALPSDAAGATKLVPGAAPPSGANTGMPRAGMLGTSWEFASGPTADIDNPIGSPSGPLPYLDLPVASNMYAGPTDVMSPTARVPPPFRSASAGEAVVPSATS